MTGEKPKKINLALDADLIPWVSYAAGLRDMSVTAYINDAIRRDRDGAGEKVKRSFYDFLEARKELGNG